MKFLSAKDLKEMIPTIGINQCREIIKKAKELQEREGFYKLETKTIIALEEYVERILRGEQYERKD